LGVIVVAQRMTRTLFAEAVVVTQRMIRTFLTEAVVIIVVAETMVWTPVAEAVQFDELEAETMMPVPTAEPTPAYVLKQSFGPARTISVEQHLSGHSRPRRRDDQRPGRSNGESQRTEYHAVQ
jgi:hypothetical protein